LIILLAFFLFEGSDSFAQMYKYVDKEGRICFTDNLTSSIVKEGVSNHKENKTTESMNSRKKSGTEVKDIMQLGQAILDEELAKPKEKQNHQLVQKMREILYGEVPGKMPENTRN
jgi:hypothetical protein